jgi:hypothetical protein
MAKTYLSPTTKADRGNCVPISGGTGGACGLLMSLSVLKDLVAYMLPEILLRLEAGSTQIRHGEGDHFCFCNDCLYLDSLIAP